jgi:hypothetical protein
LAKPIEGRGSRRQGTRTVLLDPLPLAISRWLGRG